VKISGSVALVTGASSGIGRDIAIDLARRGARVAICARRADKLAATLEETRRHAPESRAYPCDVTDRAQVRELFAAVARDLGPVDILVNNAGVGVYHLFVEAPEDEFEDVMRSNFLSAVYCTREALPRMIEAKTGSVVFISSFAGRFATYRHTAYSASKFAMTGLAEALHFEVRSSGVHVGVVYPGAIRTELFDKGEGFEHLRHVIAPRMVGTEVVTRAVAKLIEKERFEIFAPASLALVWKLRALLPRTILRGTLGYVERNMKGGPQSS
jgi:short-subunit dehydrogenase